MLSCFALLPPSKFQQHVNTLCVCVCLVKKYSNYKLIYRRYAGLFFTLCIDVTDNELLYFESIHLFVELLDQFFGNVCELDLVFNFNKVYMILDEFFLAGEVQETSKQGARRN